MLQTGVGRVAATMILWFGLQVSLTSEDQGMLVSAWAAQCYEAVQLLKGISVDLKPLVHIHIS